MRARTLAIVLAAVWPAFGYGWVDIQVPDGKPVEFHFESTPLLRLSGQPGKPVTIEQGREGMLQVQYGQELDPDRFHVTLNGKDITALLHPEPGSVESFDKLPFVLGSNQLEFEVGRVPRRDLPPGAVNDGEIHQLEVIVTRPAAHIGFDISGTPAPPPPRRK